jgi:hypothetical protein
MNRIKVRVKCMLAKFAGIPEALQPQDPEKRI